MTNPFTQKIKNFTRSVQGDVNPLSNTQPTPLPAVGTQEDDTRNPDLQNFIAWIRGNGLQKTNRFIFNIAVPQGLNSKILNYGNTSNDILLACEDISLPAKTIQTRTLRLTGLNEQRAHTVDYGGTQGFTVTFLVDHTHDLQRFFEDWTKLLVSHETREIGEYNTYIANATLHFLRPNYPGEQWTPFTQNFNTKFGSRLLERTKERATNYATQQVSKLRRDLTATIEKKKNTILGRQLGVYNKIKQATGIVDMLNEEVNRPSDVIVYSMTFKEIFPRSIIMSPLSQSSADVFKITVEFSFKTYDTQSKVVKGSSAKILDKTFNFLRRVGVPTNKSAIARGVLSKL
jgi:hypothetical protein